MGELNGSFDSADIHSPSIKFAKLEQSPSPPSAAGSFITLQSGILFLSADSIISQTSEEVSVPLKESGDSRIFISSVFCKHSYVSLEERHAFVENRNGAALIGSMGAEKELRAHMERSKAINIIAYRLIEAGIGTAHNKIGRDDNLGIGSDADFLDNLKGSRICGREFGRLLALEALYLNILILYDLAQMLLDIFCGRAGHHSEVCRNRRFLRKNVGDRAALGHGDAGSGSYERSRRRNLLHDKLRKGLKQPEVAGDDSDGICGSSAEIGEEFENKRLIY